MLLRIKPVPCKKCVHWTQLTSSSSIPKLETSNVEVSSSCSLIQKRWMAKDRSIFRKVVGVDGEKGKGSEFLKKRVGFTVKETDIFGKCSLIAEEKETDKNFKIKRDYDEVDDFIANESNSSKSSSVRRKQSTETSKLIDRFHAVLQLAGCDVNHLTESSILKVVKHFNIVLSDSEWGKEEIRRFLVTDEYALFHSGIILHHRGMDPFSLKELIKFLELLGLSKAGDSTLMLLYAEMNKMNEKQELKAYYDSKEEKLSFDNSDAEPSNKRNDRGGLKDSNGRPFFSLEDDSENKYSSEVKYRNLEKRNASKQVQHAAGNPLTDNNSDSEPSNRENRSDLFKKVNNRLFLNNRDRCENKSFRVKLRNFEKENAAIQIEYAAENSFTDDEIYNFLKNSKRKDIHEVTPKLFFNYYKALSIISPNYPGLEELRLVEGSRDNVFNFLEFLRSRHKNEVKTGILDFFSNYAKCIKEGKSKYHEKTIQLILKYIEERNNLTTEDHFTVLKNLNDVELVDHKYLIGFTINNILKNPESLEKAENLNIYLESLRSSNFQYTRRWRLLKPVIENLSILKNGEKWKEIGINQLGSIAKNLSLLGICPDSLLHFISEDSEDGQAILDDISLTLKNKFIKNQKEEVITEKIESNELNNEETEGNQNGKEMTDEKRIDNESGPNSVKSFLLNYQADLDSQAPRRQTGDSEIDNSINDYLRKTNSADYTKKKNLFAISTDSDVDSLSQEEIVDILSGASVTPWKKLTPEFLINYYTLLDKYKGDKTELKRVRLPSDVYDYIANKILQNKLSIEKMPKVLSIYAKTVVDGKEIFSETLIKFIVEKVMESDTITVEEHFSVLEAMNLMKTFNLNHLQYLVNDVLEDPSILEKSMANLNTFSEALALSDFQSQQRNQWPFLKSFIKDLSILKNEDKWKDAELPLLINTCKNLALFGVYSDPLLLFVSERVKNEPVNDPKLWNTLLILQQAVETLHPSLKNSFLEKRIIDVGCRKNGTELNKFNNFLNDVKSNLETERNESNIFLTNCYTKTGLRIDLVVALNEMERTYRFEPYVQKPKKCFVDDVSTSLPQQYQLVVVCLFEEENCCRGTLQLDSESQLKLKTFEAMGYTVVSILKKEWEDVGNEERGSYFWKKIISGSNCNIPEELVEKAREPVSID